VSEAKIYTARCATEIVDVRGLAQEALVGEVRTDLGEEIREYFG
jgi:hypothetical protein